MGSPDHLVLRLRDAANATRGVRLPTVGAAFDEAADTIERLTAALREIASGIVGQVPVTRSYLINNGIDPNFADVLLSHYVDFGRIASRALYGSQGKGDENG